MRRLSTAVPPPHPSPPRPLLPLLAALTVLLLPTAAEAASATPASVDAPAVDPASEALLGSIEKAASATTTVAGTCEWRTSKPGQDQPQVLSCTFALQAPDRYNIVETDPARSGWKKRLCSDGVMQWEIETTFAGVEPDTSSATASPDSDLNRLFACVRGDTSRLRERYALTASTTADHGVTIALAPKPGQRTDLLKGTITLDEQGHVRALALKLDGGQRMDVVILAATYGGTIGAAVFQGPPADR